MKTLKNLEWFGLFSGCLCVLLGFLTLAKFIQNKYSFLRLHGAELTDAELTDTEHENRPEEN